jgi:hypothetical protein
LAFLFATLETLGMVVARTDIFLEDNLLRGGGTDDCGEPPQRGGVPGGSARGAAIGSEHEGCEPEFRRLELTDGLFACPRESAKGFLCDRGNIAGGQSA